LRLNLSVRKNSF